MKKAISIFLLLIATAPLCQAQGLKDAYRDYWLTGVSVNQWEVAAVTSPTNKHDVTGMVSGDQTANWEHVTKHFDCVVAENCMKVSAASIANNPVVFTQEEIAELYRKAL